MDNDQRIKSTSQDISEYSKLIYEYSDQLHQIGDLVFYQKDYNSHKEIAFITSIYVDKDFIPSFNVVFAHDKLKNIHKAKWNQIIPITEKVPM